jgi:hypothetical protein
MKESSTAMSGFFVFGGLGGAHCFPALFLFLVGGALFLRTVSVYWSGRSVSPHCFSALFLRPVSVFNAVYPYFLYQCSRENNRTFVKSFAYEYASYRQQIICCFAHGKL